MRLKTVVLFLIIACCSALMGNTANARSGCCSHHGGVCGCGCCDGTSLSSTCAPYYPSCSPQPSANTYKAPPATTYQQEPESKPQPQVPQQTQPQVQPLNQSQPQSNNTDQDYDWVYWVFYLFVFLGVGYLIGKTRKKS